MKYIKKKPEIATAITFDDFIEYGKTKTTLINDMPWSFTYDGTDVTHHTDDVYLLGTHKYPKSMHGTQVRFTRGYILVTTTDEIMVMSPEEFEAVYTEYHDNVDITDDNVCSDGDSTEIIMTYDDLVSHYGNSPAFVDVVPGIRAIQGARGSFMISSSDTKLFNPTRLYLVTDYSIATVGRKIILVPVY